MNFRPHAAYPVSPGTFSHYGDAALVVRLGLGRDRLTPILAALVRQAVAKHAARAANRPAAPYAPMAGLKARLRAQVEEAIIPYTDHHRTKGETRVTVAIDPRANASMAAGTKWVSGRGGYGRVVTDTHEFISVMPGWRTHVLARGLARLDGMLTTHAHPIATPAPEGVEVYRAAWVRQKAGYNIASQTGYLAFHRPSGTAYHLANAWATIPEGHAEWAGIVATGLRRKMARQAIPTAEQGRRRTLEAIRRHDRIRAGIDRMVARFARLDVAEVADVVVTIGDSLRAGNCRAGTEDFTGRFLDGRTEATIGEIAAALRADGFSIERVSDMAIARQLAAACYQALRRARRVPALV